MKKRYRKIDIRGETWRWKLGHHMIEVRHPDNAKSCWRVLDAFPHVTVDASRSEQGWPVTPGDYKIMVEPWKTPETLWQFFRMPPKDRVLA